MFYLHIATYIYFEYPKNIIVKNIFFQYTYIIIQLLLLSRVLLFNCDIRIDITTK